MPTIRMNTDQARSTAGRMRSSSQELQAALNSASNAVSAMLAEWEGNSATQFQGEYDQWRSALNQAIQALDALTNRLESEIAEWEATASTL